MSEMVDRVAKALWEQYESTTRPWSEAKDYERVKLHADARAAMAAMREPTHQQLAEGWSQLRRNILASERLLGSGPALKEAYQAMIDATTGERVPPSEEDAA